MNSSSTQSFEIDNHFQNLDQSKVNKSKKRLVVLFVVFLLIAINAIIYYKSMGKTTSNRHSEVKGSDGGDGGDGEDKDDGCFAKNVAGMNAGVSLECQSKYEIAQDMLVSDYGNLCLDVEKNPELFQNESDCNPDMQFWWTNPYNSCDKKCQPLPGFFQVSKANQGGRDMQRPDNAWYFAMNLTEYAMRDNIEIPFPCPLGYTSIKMFTFGTDQFLTVPEKKNCHLLKGWYYNCDADAQGCDHTVNYRSKFWTNGYLAQPDATACPTGRSTYMVDQKHWKNGYTYVYASTGSEGKEANFAYGDRKVNSERICFLEEGYYGSAAHATLVGTKFPTAPLPNHTSNPSYAPHTYFGGHYEAIFPDAATILAGSNASPTYMPSVAWVAPTACGTGTWSEGHQLEDALYDSFHLSTFACIPDLNLIPVTPATVCGKYKSRMTLNYPCASGADSGVNCGDLKHAQTNTADCRVMSGYYSSTTGGTGANNAVKCPFNTSSPMFASVPTSGANCSFKVSNNNNLVSNSANSYGVTYTANENVFSNMINWADAIASRTLNRKSREMFDQTCTSSPTSGTISCIRGDMWNASTWIRNGSFATLWANIDWSGIAVMTSRLLTSENEFGYSKGSTLIGGNVYFNAFHYTASSLDINHFSYSDTAASQFRAYVIFLDINSTLKKYSVRAPGLPDYPLRMFAPEPWYSDAAFQLIDTNTPVSSTLSTFPVPRIGMDIAVPLTNDFSCSTNTVNLLAYNSLFNHCSSFSQSSNLNVNYATTTNQSAFQNAYPSWTDAPIYTGTWVTSTSKSAFTTMINKLNGSTTTLRKGLAPFHVDPVDKNIPLFIWNASKEIKLSWTTYDQITRPVPSWTFWYGANQRANGFARPTGSNTRKTIMIVTTKSPFACVKYCKGKYNLQRGGRQGDSGSPAFIIVAGKPLLIGGLHMGSSMYESEIRDILSDQDEFTERPCSPSTPKPCGFVRQSGYSAITAYWDNFTKGMTTDALGWNIPTSKYVANFCGFLGTNTCKNSFQSPSK